jgi:hypothetical protein
MLGNSLYNKTNTIKAEKCIRVPVSEEQRKEIITRIGHTTYNSLVPDKLVLSGSLLLDILDGTTYASDIDIFGAPDNCLELACKLKLEGAKVEIDNDIVGYVHKTKRYLVNTEPLKTDIIVCEEGPVSKVINDFDISRLRVYFDGFHIVRHFDWKEDKKKTMISHRAHDIHRLLIMDKGDRIIQRLIKYKQRGYSFVDLDNKDIII